MLLKQDVSLTSLCLPSLLRLGVVLRGVSRKGKDVPPSFKHFFSSAMALSCISLSGTKLPPEALK